MQYAPHAQENGSRLGGLGFVIALHVLMIWALADGLMQRIGPKPIHKTDVVVVDKEVPPPKPPPPVQRDHQPPPTVIEIWTPPDIDIVIHEPLKNAPTANPDRSDFPPNQPRQAEPRGTEAVVTPPTQAVKTAGMMCQTMGRPDLPALGVEGLASFRVLGTVRAGRVVAVEVTALRSLGDRRAMRSLVASLERTLRETYQCGSSDGQFTQDFDFRIE